MKSTGSDLNRLKELLTGTPKKITITTHANPDGDAIGSSLALFHILNQLDHQVTVIIPDAFPAFLEWVPGVKKVIIGDRQQKQAFSKIAESDILFSVDYNSPSRTNVLEEAITSAKATKVMIDHHPQPQKFVDLMFSDIKASSTAEVIYTILEESGLDHLLNKNVAICLYTGIMTDTGNFRFASTSSRTHRIVARLIDAGADHTSIYDEIYDSNTENRLRLLGYCLSEKLKVFAEYGSALISLTKEDLQKFQYKKGDTEGIVNYALSISGIKFAVFMRETDENIRISFRSKGKFDVNKFSRKNFGGGGHPNAAGGSSTLSMDETIMKFVTLLPEYRNELSKSK